MRAIGVPTYGPLSSLTELDLPEPQPGRGEVRLRVVASALNPVDYQVITGVFKILHARTKPLVVGYDFSGTIDAVGAGVTEVKVGDDVFGFLPYSTFTRQGAFSEKIVVRSTQLARKPARVSHEIAAASATTGLTALQGIRDVGRVPAQGSRVLVTGVSGGVGSIGIGIARRLGATVTAVGSGAGLELAGTLGASELLDRTKRELPGDLATKFHVVFDAAAAYRWATWRKTLEPGGTYVATKLSRALFADMITSAFTSTRVKMLLVKPHAPDLALLASWLDDGLTVPLVDTIAVRDLAAGLERIQRGGGRVAVRVADGF